MMWIFVQQVPYSVNSLCPLDLHGFFHGDAFGAFAASCISMAGLYIFPHLIYFKQFDLHQNLTVTFRKRSFVVCYKLS
jgi:hypothetical protein